MVPTLSNFQFFKLHSLALTTYLNDFFKVKKISHQQFTYFFRTFVVRDGNISKIKDPPLVPTSFISHIQIFN